MQNSHHNISHLLSLRQIPKAEEGIPTEVTTNQAFDLIASPIKSKRALSKRVTTKRARAIRFFMLDIECRGLFEFDLVGESLDEGIRSRKARSGQKS